MQLPTIASSDSESDDDVDLYQVPESVHLQAAVQAEASAGLQADDGTTSDGQRPPEQHPASKPGSQPSSTVPAVHNHNSCNRPAQVQLGSSSGQHTSSSMPSNGEALVTSLLQALGFPEPEAAPDPAPGSVPLSSTSSASHVLAAAEDRRASSSSSSSSDTDSSATDIDLYSNFSTSTATGSSTAGAPAADKNSLTVLEMDGLLADSDLDALLKRLTASRAAVGAGASTAADSVPAQHTAGRSMCRQSSSNLSSDNSSSSLVSDPQVLDSSSPPPSSSYSSYEPRWLKQQQRQQQQDCAGSKSSSIAGSTGSPMRKLPCAERLWVPEPPSTVLDLRSSAATVKGASAAAAAAEGGAAPCADTNVLEFQAGGSVKTASKAAGSGMWVGDSGSESDSSEEDWQQFRQRQRGGTGVVAPAVAQKQPV